MYVHRRPSVTRRSGLTSAGAQAFRRQMVPQSVLVPLSLQTFTTRVGGASSVPCVGLQVEPVEPSLASHTIRRTPGGDLSRFGVPHEDCCRASEGD